MSRGECYWKNVVKYVTGTHLPPEKVAALGYALGVHPDKIKNAMAKHTGDFMNAFIDTLQYWLTSERNPEWEKLAQVFDAKFPAMASKLREYSGKPNSVGEIMAVLMDSEFDLNAGLSLASGLGVPREKLQGIMAYRGVTKSAQLVLEDILRAWFANDSNRSWEKLEKALDEVDSKLEPDSRTHAASGDGNKPEGDESQPKGQPAWKPDEPSVLVQAPGVIIQPSHDTPQPEGQSVEPDSRTHAASGDGNKPEGDKSEPKGQPAWKPDEPSVLVPAPGVIIQPSHDTPQPEGQSGTDISAVGNDPNVQADGGSTNKAEGEKKKWQITYCSDKVLGHGNNGTMVYKGSFDKRSVAVKRLLSENFDFADKEAKLLRLSDGHANVVRYHLIEKQGDFTCIALELGQGTLYDYVNHRSKITGCMNSVDLLEQAMKGLAYLHSIDIVHRDIKPHNVLLSFPSSSGSVKAMISDFGHSRKLPDGKLSFTSSRLGTPGWAAPEVLDNSKRMTFAVDIFSMGCVIYYVLTSGCHPFGPSTHWQANVVDNKHDLSDLSKIDMYTASDLLESMISHDSNSRPTAKKVLCHCLFWSGKKQLDFFQDVSNIMDKKCNNSPVYQSLEKNSSIVCEGDWMNNICGKLKEDLLNHGRYQGSSVTHLLRAIRNKRQHYKELPEELKQSLGRIPDEYVHYFTSRFPQLLIHTYKSMETCKEENITKTYYTADFSK